MKRKAWVLLIALTTINVAADVSFSVPTDINAVMTKAEQKAIGVDKMTPEQRAALRKWMESYALRVANALVKAAQQ